MGVLRINKSPFYPLRTAKIGRQQRSGQQRKQQLTQGKHIRDRREGKSLYRQQQGDEQPDNIVFRHHRAPLEKGDILVLYGDNDDIKSFIRDSNSEE